MHFFGFGAAPIPSLYYFDGIYDPLPDDLQEKVRQGKKYAFYTCPPGRHWQNYLDQVSAGTTKLRNIFPVNIMPAAFADENPEIANLLDGRDGGPSLRHRRFGDKIVFCVPALQRRRVYNTFEACDRLVEELIMERDLNVFIFPNSHFLGHCGEIPNTIVPLEGLLNGDITP